MFELLVEGGGVDELDVPLVVLVDVGGGVVLVLVQLVLVQHSSSSSKHDVACCSPGELPGTHGAQQAH